MNSTYNELFNNFKTAFNRMVATLSNRLNDMSIKNKTFGSTTLTLENNTIHRWGIQTGVSNLTIKYPQGEFISTVLFSTSNTGPISIKFPDETSFVGAEELEFFPSEDWELNIHNGRVVGARIYTNK